MLKGGGGSGGIQASVKTSKEDSPSFAKIVVVLDVSLPSKSEYDLMWAVKSCKGRLLKEVRGSKTPIQLQSCPSSHLLKVPQHI